MAIRLQPHVDGAGGRRVLQARGQVHGVAQHREVALHGSADPARENEPGVDPHVQTDRHRQRALLVQAGDVVAHLDRRVDGLLGGVLERGRGPEDRHDAIADVLVDEAAVTPDRGLEGLEAAVDDGGHLFGVQPLRHRGESRDVREHHGRDAAFARPFDLVVGHGGAAGTGL